MAGNLDMVEEYHQGYENQEKAFVRGAVVSIKQDEWSLTGDKFKQMELKQVFVLLQNWTRIGINLMQVTITLNIGGKDFPFILQRKDGQITVYDSLGHPWRYNGLFSIFNNWEDHSLIARLMLQSADEFVGAQTLWEKEHKDLANRYYIGGISISVGDAMRMLMVIGQVAEAARPTEDYYRTVTQMMHMKTEIETAANTQQGWEIFESNFEQFRFANRIPTIQAARIKIKEAPTTKEQARIAWELVIEHVTGKTGRVPGADKLFRKVLGMVASSDIKFNEVFHYFFVLSMNGGTGKARKYLLRPGFNDTIFVEHPILQQNYWKNPVPGVPQHITDTYARGIARYQNNSQTLISYHVSYKIGTILR